MFKLANLTFLTKSVQAVRQTVFRSCSSLVGRDYLTLKDFTGEEIKKLLWVASDLKHRIKEKNEIIKPLVGRTMAMIFQKRSTRTRISSEGGFALLGGHAVAFSPDDSHLDIHESLQDTSRVLSRLSDIILARVYGHSDIEEVANHASVPVINALSESYHPLQGLADILTLLEHYGSVRGMTLTWVGDGTNIIHTLMMVAPRFGLNLRIATPKGYEVFPEIARDAANFAKECKTTIEYTNDPFEACEGTNVIVADTWISMGKEHETEQRLRDFQIFKVTKKMTSLAADNWCFLQCLPKHEREVDDEVFYSDRSLVWQEAENRKWTVMSVMLNLLQDFEPKSPKPNY